MAVDRQHRETPADAGPLALDMAAATADTLSGVAVDIADLLATGRLGDAAAGELYGLLSAVSSDVARVRSRLKRVTGTVAKAKG